MKNWSNLAQVVYKRTYSRSDDGIPENWEQTVDRAIVGNVRNHRVAEKEVQDLRALMMGRKATPGGRGLWFSGAPTHEKLGGAALNNCWALTADDWVNFVVAQDLLMLGGGVGLSVEHRFVSKLPKVKSAIIICKNTKDADFITPDSREGWNDLIHRVLESFFVTGKDFTYSTVCVRGKGERIEGFGGESSGPLPLIRLVEKLCSILLPRIGKHVRPVDAMDIICCIGEMVVSGNVRRSAIIILGDPWDREYLTAKRWDLKDVPVERSCANLSVVCSDTEDLHPSFWKTYEVGEPYGIVNRGNIQKYGRMGDEKPDTGYLVNPCGESTLESFEPCNLAEIFLPNLHDKREFNKAARLMFRWCRRVATENYHHIKTSEVVSRNMRVGVGITGCLQSKLFSPTVLSEVYETIEKENCVCSKQSGLPKSIRTTLIKPSGTLSLIGETLPGIHPAFAEYFIRRVRFSSTDKLIPCLREAGHPIQPASRFDGTHDHNTLVVNFFGKSPEGTPTVKDVDTWQQLEHVKMAQKYWADQSISVTVYYDRKNIGDIKDWLSENLKHLKTISFLCHSDHGFDQAPLEEITEDQYSKAVDKIKPVDFSIISSISEHGENFECPGGSCPAK